MSGKSRAVVQLTTVHGRGDVRIAIKECSTLASRFGDVELVVADGLGSDPDREYRVIDLGTLGSSRSLRALRGFLRSVSYLRRRKPAVLHFHDPELIPVGLVARALGIRVIYDVHEDLPRHILQKDWIPPVLRRTVAAAAWLCEWIGARSFNAIVATTPKIAERFPDSKVTMIRNFPISAEFSDNPFASSKCRPNEFVYVGAISASRGGIEMVTAIGKLEPNRSAELVLAGHLLPESFAADLRFLPGWKRTRYEGWVSRTRISSLLGRAQAGLVLLHPTQSYQHAYPIKMFEYMAAGLPVIASDFPLWRSIVEGAACGLLVDPRDPQAIADAMRWILDHPADADAMGRRGREAVESCYSWSSEAEKLVRLYETLLT